MVESVIPETKVIAIASHVVYGHVGNTMAAFVMQALGCEVAALNTVQFSNHTGYKQFKGTRTSAEEITEIYEGLKQSYLTDFDILLSGYAPSADAVKAIGSVARDLKLKASTKPGAFFWVLDPVMGDEGQLYVSEEVVPVYKSLLRDAHLVLPNQYEAELLSGVTIESEPDIMNAISTLHQDHRIPHVVITSVRLPSSSTDIFIYGSTSTSSLIPRIFRIGVPVIDCFFSGTGDMFAALTVVRFREAIFHAGLEKVGSWVSPDKVEAKHLPLAEALEKVLGSMQTILEKTKKTRDEKLKEMGGELGVSEMEKGSDKRAHLRMTKAAEVGVVRCLEDLRKPGIVYRAEAMGDGEEEEEEEAGVSLPEPKAW